MSKFEWTAKAIDRLADMWADGKTASVIAKELGASRNAVIGKVHRLQKANIMGLESRPSPVNLGSVKNRGKPGPKPKLLAIGQVKPRPGQSGGPKSFADLIPGECQFATNGTRPFKFCAKEAIEGKPYCAAHYNACYVKPAKPQRPEGREFKPKFWGWRPKENEI